MSRLPRPLTGAVGGVGRARRRIEDGLRARVATVRERDRDHGERAAAEALSFGGGYLVHHRDAPCPSAVSGWANAVIGDHHHHTARHPHTGLPLTSTTLAGGRSLVLLGHPVDVDAGTARARVVVDHLAAVDEEAGGGDAGEAAVLRRAAYLGGRWVLLLHEASGGITVLPDALASRPAWHTADGHTTDRTVLASHATLLPGASLLSANTLLRVRPHGGGASTERFWPWGEGPAAIDTSGTDAEATYREFRERLLAHTALLSSLGHPGVPLTAGVHSRAVLAAYLPHGGDGYAFTAFDTASARQGREQAHDLFAASALAHRLGLPHRVVRAVAPPEKEALAMAYLRTYPDGDCAAGAFARHALPPGTVELHSAGAGTTDRETWERLDRGYLEGDLIHPVMLPFNDRRLLELMVGGDDPAGPPLVRRLAAELDQTPAPGQP